MSLLIPKVIYDNYCNYIKTLRADSIDTLQILQALYDNNFYEIFAKPGQGDGGIGGYKFSIADINHYLFNQWLKTNFTCLVYRSNLPEWVSVGYDLLLETSVPSGKNRVNLEMSINNEDVTLAYITFNCGRLGKYFNVLFSQEDYTVEDRNVLVPANSSFLNKNNNLKESFGYLTTLNKSCTDVFNRISKWPEHWQKQIIPILKSSYPTRVGPTLRKTESAPTADVEKLPENFNKEQVDNNLNSNSSKQTKDSFIFYRPILNPETPGQFEVIDETLFFQTKVPSQVEEDKVSGQGEKTPQGLPSNNSTREKKEWKMVDPNHKRKLAERRRDVLRGDIPIFFANAVSVMNSPTPQISRQPRDEKPNGKSAAASSPSIASGKSSAQKKTRFFSHSSAVNFQQKEGLVRAPASNGSNFNEAVLDTDEVMKKHSIFPNAKFN